MPHSVVLLLLILALLALRQNLMVILAVSVAFMHLAWGDGNIQYIIEDVWNVIDKEAFLSIPMFILVGAVMTRGSIARRLINIMIALAHRLRGGLGEAVILSCAIFSSVSGSSAVTLLAVGAILYPALLQENYPKKFALGAITSGSTLGIIIPPSIPLIIYGLATETSTVDLFKAGLLPGLLLTALMFAYARRIHKASEHPARATQTVDKTQPALRETIIRGGPALLMPVILLGGIYSGWYSPTESAAIALAYALIVETFIHRELKLADLYKITQETITLLGTIVPIIAIAASVNLFLASEGIPASLTGWVQANVSNLVLFIICVNLLLLVTGCFVDTISALLILSPLLMPIATSYGMDPVHFGIMMVLNLEIGLLTPPMGINLLVAATAFKERFLLVATSVVPFVILMLLALTLVSFVPGLSLWLVR